MILEYEPKKLLKELAPTSIEAGRMTLNKDDRPRLARCLRDVILMLHQGKSTIPYYSNIGFVNADALWGKKAGS